MQSEFQLPDIIDFNMYQKWDVYEDALYQVFYNDFIVNKTMIKGKNINIRKNPKIYGKEQAFFHITSVSNQADSDPNDRIPDIKRCEKIGWIKYMIEYYNHHGECGEQLRYWEEDYNGKPRIHLLCETERFIVVIEERKDYCLFITAYYIEHQHTLRKKLKKYQQYQKGQQKTPRV